MFYFDYSYIILIPAMIFALVAQAMVTGTFNKFNKVASAKGLTGADAARIILQSNGLNLPIERIAGNLTDHFDPRTNVIRLSDSVYGSTGIAAIGVAAHEAGHAVQHAEGYGPMKLRAAIIPVTNIGSRLAIPIFIIGLLISYELALVGVILFSLTAVFQAVTLPVEFNASRRALAALDASGTLYGDELKGARKVLSAAAMTYVAALASSVAQILRLLIILGGRRKD